MEPGALALGEPPLGYYPYGVDVLTECRETGLGTVSGGQFDWGGLLLKSNGGARRYPQVGRKSTNECNGIRVLDCERDISSRNESWF